MKSGETNCLDEICAWFAQCDAHSAGVVVLPAYRPDVVKALAVALGLTYLDFRREILAPLGWRAAAVPLSALDEAVLTAMKAGVGVVFQNAEALLSLHDAPTRRQWLADVLSAKWPHKLLVPIVLFDNELPVLPDRICRIDSEKLPEESLLTRLASV